MNYIDPRTLGCKPDFYSKPAEINLTAVAYNNTRRWRPGPFHVNERGLSARYGVRGSFAEWRTKHGFPPPISDFGPYAAPWGNWWHRSILAAWERCHSRRRDWSALTIEHKKIHPPQPSCCAAVNLASETAPSRTGKKGAQRPTLKQDLSPLTKDEERELIKRYQGGDRTAAQKIILSVLPSLRWIASKYANNGFPIEELVQQGIVGQVSAAGRLQSGCYYALEKFNEESDCRFSTFAQDAIRWAISNYVKRNRNVPSETPSENLVDEAVNLEPVWDGQTYDDAGATLQPLLDRLTERERHVMEARHGLNGKAESTLAEIGAELNLSRERVRQIEKQVKQKFGLVA